MTGVAGDPVVDEIRVGVRELCARFPGEYWRALEPSTYPDEFVRALTEAGLGAEAATALRGDFSFKSGVDLAEEMLAGPQRPTAIVCANDDMAAGVLSAAHARGLNIPKDLSITGFDDAPVAAIVWPPTLWATTKRRTGSSSRSSKPQMTFCSRTASRRSGISLMVRTLIMCCASPPANTFPIRPLACR